ncbi:DUF2061 domain-containing protein [Candidatus Woesearchaeota archaeon]|nr:DUF2061 domain-containing protein [Candidatus Woesearchaeota archaeon]
MDTCKMRKETHARTLIKSITWRIIATMATIIIVYLLTDNFGIATAAGLVEVVTKLIIYYLHERAWIHVPWGIKKNAR